MIEIFKTSCSRRSFVSWERLVKEEQRNTQQRYYNSSTNYTGQTGHSQQSKQSKEKKIVGEYIDYEEIE